jgi:hypothetical protein
MKAFMSRVHDQISLGKEIDVFWLQDEDSLEYIIPPDGMIQLRYQPVYVINRGCQQNRDHVKD